LTVRLDPRIVIPRLYSRLARRVLVRRNWPNPEDFDRMHPRVLNAYLVATGFEADMRESLAEMQGDRHQGGTVASLRAEESSVGGQPGRAEVAGPR
jgi:hypothetical protein